MLTPTMGPATPVTLACCDSELTVDVPPNTAWEITPQLRGAWAPKSIAVAGQVHRVRLWPVSRVSGRIQTGKGEQFAGGMAVTILDTPAHRSGIPPGQTTDCAVDASGTFRCELPAAKLDLTFAAAGYVPVQVWDVDLRSVSGRDVGPLPLRQGASVSGWVDKGAAATVEIVPLVASGGATSERVARTVAKTTSLPNGFFQLTGIPVGRYALRIARPGYATETITPVVVYAGRETAIRKVIVLRHPITVAVAFVPPRDWRGEPWGIAITKASLNSGAFDDAPFYQGRAGGRVVVPGQSAGRYSVDVFDSAGNPMKNEQFDVDGAADVEREIDVDTVKVHGTVSLGGAPLETTLWFGGRYGAQHVALRSDVKGRFRGVLPVGGDWRVVAAVDGDDVETTATINPDGEASVDIKLPDNRIGGVVVDGNGNPVPNADVTLMTPQASVTHRSGSDGRFTFRCIEEGDVSVAASVKREKLLTSDPAMLKVPTAEPVQLVVHEGQRLTGTVQSIHGPIAGAAVLAVPLLEQSVGARATTDLDGHFKVDLPGQADRAYVTVRAPGYALRVFDVPLPDHGLGFNVPLSGGTLDLVFPKDPMRNVALLLFQDERPLPMAEVAHWAMSHGTPPTDNGVHAADMAPAAYKACVSVRQLVRREQMSRWIAAARCVSGTLAPFGTLRLEIPKPE